MYSHKTGVNMKHSTWSRSFCSLPCLDLMYYTI